MSERVTVWVRLPSALIARLDRYQAARDARGEDGTRSATVRALLLAALDTMDGLEAASKIARGRRT